MTAILLALFAMSPILLMFFKRTEDWWLPLLFCTGVISGLIAINIHQKFEMEHPCLEYKTETVWHPDTTTIMMVGAVMIPINNPGYWGDETSCIRRK